MALRPILLDLLAIAAIVGLPHLGLTPNFTYVLPILLVTWIALRARGERFADIGFRFRSCSKRAALTGALAAVAILALMQLLVFPVLELFIEFEPEDIGLREILEDNPVALAVMIVMAWLVGGFYEEIVFHGFVFTRLETILPGKNAAVSSFVVTSFLFGAYHLQMGLGGALNALVVGTVYLGLFLYFERNLWASIVCHGVYNTIVMTLMSMGHL